MTTLRGHELTRRRDLHVCGCGVIIAGPGVAAELAQVRHAAHVEREIAVRAVTVPVAGDVL